MTRRRGPRMHATSRRPADYAEVVWCYLCQAQLGAGSFQALLRSHVTAAGHVTCSKCSLASGIFLDTDALDEHAFAVHACVRCLYCPAMMKSTRLEKHEEEVHREEVKAPPSPALILCPCGEEFCFNDTVEAHWTASANHPSCPVCLAGFQDDFELEHHRRSDDKCSSHDTEYQDDAIASSLPHTDSDTQGDSQALTPPETPECSNGGLATLEKAFDIIFQSTPMTRRSSYTTQRVQSPLRKIRSCPHL